MIPEESVLLLANLEGVTTELSQRPYQIQVQFKHWQCLEDSLPRGKARKGEGPRT